MTLRFQSNRSFGLPKDTTNEETQNEKNKKQETGGEKRRKITSMWDNKRKRNQLVCWGYQIKIIIVFFLNNGNEFFV